MLPFSFFSMMWVIHFFSHPLYLLSVLHRVDETISPILRMNRVQLLIRNSSVEETLMEISLLLDDALTSFQVLKHNLLIP